MPSHAPRSKTSWKTLAILLLFALLAFAALRIPELVTDTEYAPGYSERAFDALAIGDEESRVIELLGQPLERSPSTPSLTWLYCGPDHPGYAEDGGIRGTFTEFEFGVDGHVQRVFGQVERTVSEGFLSKQMTVSLGENSLGISADEAAALRGKTREEIAEGYGQPRYRREHLATEILIYSRSPSSTHYKLRHVGVDASGKVVTKRQYFYWD